MKINVPASVGELFDKITILEIKKKKIKDKEKLKHVNAELNLLNKVVTKKKTVSYTHLTLPTIE